MYRYCDAAVAIAHREMPKKGLLSNNEMIYVYTLDDDV